ncbi:hypothetical protein DMUE_4080 [Dictyocoela muelleri]|nr:hypothetical protein DMUE_4080 [Dictyocoela muelleri]
MEKIFSGISLSDGIVYSRFAWDDVTDKTILNRFKKTFSYKENEYDIYNEIKNLADDEEIDNFDQETKYLLPTDICDKTEFLDFNVGFFDFFDDRFGVSRLEDSMIEESDIEKDYK